MSRHIVLSVFLSGCFHWLSSVGTISSIIIFAANAEVIFSAGDAWRRPYVIAQFRS